jgi:hypothetical protein
MDDSSLEGEYCEVNSKFNNAFPDGVYFRNELEDFIFEYVMFKDEDYMLKKLFEKWENKNKDGVKLSKGQVRKLICFLKFFNSGNHQALWEGIKETNFGKVV